MQQRTTLALVALLGALGTGCGSSDSDDAQGTGGGATGGTGGAGGTGGTGGGLSALALAPGQVAEIALEQGQGSVRLATPAGTEKYVLILASTLLDASTDAHTYSVSTAGSPTWKADLVSSCSLTPDKWKNAAIAPETPPSGSGAKVGDKRSIVVGLPAGSEAIDAEAIAVGSAAVVWKDVTAAHPAVLDAAFVQEFLADFEKTILPRARAVFGVESDADNDGHVQLVFSPLTHKTAVAFFTSCDLAKGLGCPGGNAGEYLYLTPPNAIDPPYNTPNAIKEILAHELSHMIHFNRKVLKNALLGWNESAYMGEGVGAFAQDVLGYQSGNLYVTKAGLDGIGGFSLGQTLGDSVEYDLSRDGVLRGGSYLFVRWLYDRAGGDLAKLDGSVDNQGGIALLRKLLDAPESIAAALPATAGAPIETLAADFWTTLAMSNRDVDGGPAPENPCFAYLPTASDPVTTRQRGANLFASFHGQQMKGPKLQSLSEADGSIEAGGGELISVDAVSGQAELSVGVTVAAAAAPRVRIGRIE